MSERLVGMVGEQRTRFVEAYATEPNRVGIPADLLPEEPPREIMGMAVRVLDWQSATVTVWRERGDGDGDLSPQPPLRSGEGEDDWAAQLADRWPTNSLSAYLKLQASQRAHGHDISFARLEYAARWARQMEDRIGALRVALTAIATMEDVPAQEIATTALREDLAAAALGGRYPADGGEGGRGARTTEGEQGC